MNQGPRLPLCGKWKACLQNRCSARLEPSTCQNTEWKTRRVNEHATPLAYRPFAESWSFPNKAKYASMRTLPDPFGIPGPSFMPSLSARTIPKFYPPDFKSACDADPNPSGRRLAPCARQPNGKEQPRVSASRPAGHSPPGGKSFHSASFEAKHRNSTTIRRAGQSRIAFRSVPRDADDCNSTVPSCVFFYQNTQNPASPDTEGGWEKMPPRCFNHNPVTGDALRRVHVHSSHKSGIGPAREVPAPPSIRGVRTRKGRNVLPPSGRQARPQHEEYPSLRPVNTEPRGDTGTRRILRVGLRTSQSRRL